MKKQKSHEYLIFRPTLPEGWYCLEQTESARCGSTSYVTEAKTHHNGEPQKIFVVFNEFNPNHWENDNLGYKYTVRGGNFVKPEEKIRYFQKLKDAENYMIYLMESTNKWVEEINSPAYIDAYNRRIESMKKRLEKEIE